MKVLLLYASFGDGHKQVATALAEAFAACGADVVSVDCFRQTNRGLARINEWLYETLTRFAPFIYGWSYDWTRQLSPNHPLWALLALFSRRATWRALMDHQPDLVVQLFPDHALAKFPRFLPKKPVMAAALTDFAVHARWFHKNIGLYLMPTELTAAAGRRYVHSGAGMAVTGIPIRSQFSYCDLRFDCAESRQPIVVSAGGRGVFPDLVQVLARLQEVFAGVPIVVLCGRNRQMYEQVAHLRGEVAAGANLQPLGFTDNVASWIQRARFVVAKAGGLTVSECLAAGTPLLFYKPQPGQERRNALAVEQMGAGCIARNLGELIAVLPRFHGETLAQMQEKCMANGHPAAAQAAVHTLISYWRHAAQQEPE